MYNSKNKFYKYLKVDKVTREAIKFFNQIKRKMLKETSKQKAK